MNSVLLENPNFRLAITDLLRLHVIQSWGEKEIGMLRVVIGDGFERVSARDYYFERLRRAYGETTYMLTGFARPEIELARDGKVFAEFSRSGLSEHIAH